MALDSLRRRIGFQVPKIGTPQVKMRGGCGHWVVACVTSTDCEMNHEGPMAESCTPPRLLIDFA